MSEDEFTKLFKYIQTIEKKLDGLIENVATKDEIQKVLGLLDALAKRQEINERRTTCNGTPIR